MAAENSPRYRSAPSTLPDIVDIVMQSLEERVELRQILGGEVRERLAREVCHTSPTAARTSRPASVK